MAHLQGGSLSTVSRSNWNLKVLDLKDFVAVKLRIIGNAVK